MGPKMGLEPVGVPRSSSLIKLLPTTRYRTLDGARQRSVLATIAGPCLVVTRVLVSATPLVIPYGVASCSALVASLAALMCVVTTYFWFSC